MDELPLNHPNIAGVCGFESNPWDVHSIETVVAGGDGLQEVVGDNRLPR